MHRIARIASLLVVLGIVLWASMGTLPGLVDASDGQGEDCRYTYLVFEVDDPTASERASATDYENLSTARRAAFDEYLETDEGAAEIDKTVWNALFAQSDRIHYIVHEGQMYRARPLLRDCQEWQRYGNKTIPPVAAE